ncbi:MAG: enoyl-CoA hydratase/isomerase family protein [Acidobacteriota bacterium]|nr:enoyl-CoA hydratase/isomerase family protein [Acidobacteriota bacterium]
MDKPALPTEVNAAFEFSEVVPSILLCQFTRPAERNPLSISTLTDLSNSLPNWFDCDHIEAIIFTGAGDVFASGANIRELTSLDRSKAKRFSELGQNLLNSISRARQRTIAAINGYCIGGALDLALACDVRIASAKATFAHPGARLGIITGWGGTQRLPRLIGKTRALELFATARTLDARNALEIGLIDRIDDPVLEAALRLAVTH